MYLENSEQGKVSGEGEPSTEVMIAEQCQVPKLTEAAVLTSSPKESADLGMEVFVEYGGQTVVSREIDSSILCVEDCNMTREETESHIYCNGRLESFEQYSPSEGFFQPDQIVGRCETSGLSQPFDECAQHCECFKPCKSFEHRANHSLAPQCSPCCEHCVEHLQLFQQCEPSDQQLDFDPDKLAVNGDSFGQFDLCDFIPECPDELELLQQYELSDQQRECFDSEPDASVEESERCEMSGFTPDISNSVDLLARGSEPFEYDELKNQTECSDDDGADEESYPPEQEGEQTETEPFDEESGSLSEDVNSSHFDAQSLDYYNDSEDASCASESCETEQLTGENYEQAVVSAGNSEMCESDYSAVSQECEPTQQCSASEQCSSDSISEFCTEEEDSSDCSSVETKSFKTCPDGSIPSDHCFDSCGESEKGAQEDSSDEQTQWESFEDDEETEQSNFNGSNEGKKEKPTVDIVIDDYFDLFDRVDYGGCTFPQKQHYISCFDGGDIHDGLYLEEVKSEAQKLAKKSQKHKEVNKEIDLQETDKCFDETKEACESTREEDARLREDPSAGPCESEKRSDDGILGSESSLADVEVEGKESETDCLHAEDCEEAEEEEDTFDADVCVSDSHVCEIYDEEEAEVYLFSGNEESMCAPCADDISVEGDAYEDEVSDSQKSESLDDDTSTISHLYATFTDCKKENEDEQKPELNEFITCSEMEPYWSLVGLEENGEMSEPGAEDYYAYQIKSIQWSVKQALNGYIKEGRSYCQILDGKVNGDASENESDDVLSLTETEFQAQRSPEECKVVRFGITEVIELSEDFAHCSVVEKTTNAETPESDESGFGEVLREIKPPSAIIHSVSELARDEGGANNKASEQSEDSEEEQIDDESSEPCECEYCSPPIEKVPAKPLLPRMKSNDAGKICVVIDLDETLVHSSFKPVNNADFIIPVEIDGTVHQVYVLKRPHVDEFLKRMGELFECVLFTASLSKYADPVSDLLDKWGAFRSRLFRESCVFHKGNYVKDLSRLGRDLNKVIIIDNSPASYIFHPENAVPVASWFDDMSDTELLDLIPFFERLSKEDDIYNFLTKQRISS